MEGQISGGRMLDEAQMNEGAKKIESEAAGTAAKFSGAWEQLSKENPDAAKAFMGMSNDEKRMIIDAGSKLDTGELKTFLATIGEQVKGAGGERMVDASLLKQAKDQLNFAKFGVAREGSAPTEADIANIEAETGMEKGSFVSGSTMEAAPVRMQEQLSAQKSAADKRESLLAAMRAEEAAKIARIKKQPPQQQAAA